VTNDNDINDRLAAIDELLARDITPREKALARSTRSWLLQYQRALAGEGPQTVQEVLDLRKHGPLWMRERAIFQLLLEAGALVEDDATGHVTLRWALIADEHRGVAVSWANEVVGLYRGRTAGGRPKKTDS